MISATIEEFEQGTWVAELIGTEAFDGSFTLPDGSVWTGTKLSERVEFQQYHTIVVGGAGLLGAVVKDKYYSGNVALSVAISDLCEEAGETAGAVSPGVFLSTYQRQAGPATEALDAMAHAFNQVWWIGRDGKLQMAASRPPASEATGERVSSDVDASFILVNPTTLQLGASYAPTDPIGQLGSVRHIRWRLTPDRFQAQVYALPFLFRSPTNTKYSRSYDAVVQADNGDGTVDVYADSNRFGVSKVQLLCGVPGAKVKVKAGEKVTLGFFAADPQKPYCFCMAQNTGATKAVARNGDSVKVTLDATAISTLAPFISAPPGAGGGPCTGLPGSVDVNGTVTQGTSRIMVDDG